MGGTRQSNLLLLSRETITGFSSRLEIGARPLTSLSTSTTSRPYYRSLPAIWGSLILGFPTFHGVPPKSGDIRSALIIQSNQSSLQSSIKSNLASPSKSLRYRLRTPSCPCSATVSGFSQVIFPLNGCVPCKTGSNFQWRVLYSGNGLLDGGRTRRRLHSLLPSTIRL